MAFSTSQNSVDIFQLLVYFWLTMTQPINIFRSDTERESGHELADLDKNQCRFPVRTVGKHHQFCGEPTSGTYCSEHHSRVWQPALPRVRRPRPR